MSDIYCGRKVLLTDETVANDDNVLNILNAAVPWHKQNALQIQYLWNYYRGRQPILERVKAVRPEICAKIVENRANEIVAFKTGYLMGEPIQYVSKGEEDILEDLNELNRYVFAEEKSTKDKELAEWMHICGTGFRMVLPDEEGDEDESPFEIYTQDPRFTFVVYNNGLGKKPVLGVTYVVDTLGQTHYTCYGKNQSWEIVDGKVMETKPHILGEIPIIEYPLNNARLGAFEIVLPLLDSINDLDSNRQDSINQFVQALMVFYNTDIEKEKYKELREEGAIKVRDLDPQMKAKVEYLVASLPQGETQVTKDDMYESVLTICGMPNRNGGSSTSDTGQAVALRDGWSSAEARAKDTELMFKRSERKFLRVILEICSSLRGTNLKVSNIEIRFTRRNYENIYMKAQVLDLMLKNNKIDPKLGFEHCGLFVDPDLAYTISKKYAEEQEKKQLEMMQKEAEIAKANSDNTGDGEDNAGPAPKGQQGGAPDRAGQGNNRRNQEKKESTGGK